MDAKLFVLPSSVALVLVAFAGCLGQANDALDTDLLDLGAVLEGAIVPTHDHADPAVHDQSFNMEVLSYSPATPAPSVYGEVDVRGGIAAIAVLATAKDANGDSQRSGFVLFDAMKPEDLSQPLGRWEAPVPTVYAADVKLSDDGKWAFLATQRTGSLVTALLAERGQALPASPPAPVPIPNNGADVGVYVVDISDPTDPTTALFFPVETNGVHMMDVQSVNGVMYLFLQAATVYPRCATPPLGVMDPQCVPDQVPNPPGAGIRVDIAEFTTDPSPKVRVVQTYDAIEGHYIHDITVLDDPILQKTVMYVAHWDAGARIVDVSGLPGSIVEVGAWAPEEFLDEPDLLGHVHTVWAEVIGDEANQRRVLVASPEFGFRENQPPIWFVDATDEAMPVQLGDWSLPCPVGCNFTVDMQPEIDYEYRWSTHNIVIEHGLLYLSHFHGGTWVFDLMSDPANPTVVGYTMLAPPMRGPGAFGGILNDSPSVWDSVPYEGHIWISDINAGLFTARLIEAPERAMAMGDMAGMDHGG